MEFNSNPYDTPNLPNEADARPLSDVSARSFAMGPEPTSIVPPASDVLSHVPELRGPEKSEHAGETTEVGDVPDNQETPTLYTPSGGLLVDVPDINGVKHIIDNGPDSPAEAPRYHARLLTFETQGIELDKETHALVAEAVSGTSELPDSPARIPGDEDWNTIKTNEASMQRVASRLGISIIDRLVPRSGFHFYENRQELDGDFVALTGKPAPSHGNYLATDGVFMIRPEEGDPETTDSTLRHEQAHRLGYHLFHVEENPAGNIGIRARAQGVQRMDGEVVYGQALNESMTDYLACLAARDLNVPFSLGYGPFDFVVDEAIRETAARLEVPPQIVANQWLRDYFTGDDVALKATQRAMGTDRTEALMQARGATSAEETMKFAEQLGLRNVAPRFEKSKDLFRWQR